ncbi:response regulator [Mycoplana dimorpha]|uniref:Response regulator receiver domain-containing protein n=1 Tax=Mycoplana dimorpha TaxID=28320 RepID=A0A2T5B3P0_MYCDI|nr:response regulator [Mycoplana dimorpha]PTM93593.1 hypothetical protein C7449_106279 [Mycoplana dimorpha]
MKEAYSYARLFNGKRILVVENEYFLTRQARLKMEEFGAIVVGPTGSVELALKFIHEQPIDAAILDVHLAAELVLALSDRLIELGIAFVFATAYDPSLVADRFPGYLLCDDPTALGQIAKALFATKRPIH